MNRYQGWVLRSGTNKVQHGIGNTSRTIINAPNTGNVEQLVVMRVVLMVTVAAVGGGGTVAITDGQGTGDDIVKVDADTVGVYNFDFSSNGIVLTDQTSPSTVQSLGLITAGAATTQATARGTALIYQVVKNK